MMVKLLRYWEINGTSPCYQSSAVIVPNYVGVYLKSLLATKKMSEQTAEISAFLCSGSMILIDIIPWMCYKCWCWTYFVSVRMGIIFICVCLYAQCKICCISISCVNNLFSLLIPCQAGGKSVQFPPKCQNIRQIWHIIYMSDWYWLVCGVINQNYQLVILS